MARSSVVQNVRLNSFEDIFGGASSAGVTELRLSELYTFENHPFCVRDDEDMADMTESVKENGILTPILVRPRKQGGYEIVAGHRRRRAAELAGLERIPAMIRELDDDAAVIGMVDTNLQRQTLLPSEKAFAYKMKLDAMKRKAGRKSNVSRIGTQKRSDELLAEQTGESRSNIQRYVRLTVLCRELLEMVDEKRLSLNAGVELSFLEDEWQNKLYVILTNGDGCPAPSLSQAARLRQYGDEGRLSAEVIRTVLDEPKPVSKVSFSGKRLKQYFPQSYTPQQMEDTIIKLLERWCGDKD